MKKLAVILLSFIFVVSCGGGGGGGGGSTPPPNPAPSVNLSASASEQLVNSNVTLTWSSSNATSCSASGDWSGTKSTSGSEDVTISKAGSNTYSLACSGAGGNRSDVVNVVGYRNTDGIVVDGYISGADVFIDENDNFVNDGSEYSTTSDNEGKFTIRYANGNLVSIGGTDLDSQILLDNLLITHKLSGHSEFKAVTPVTSIEAFMEVGANINNALGIDSAIDISITDPVANKGDGGIYDFLYEKGNQLTVLAYALQNITNDLNTTSETTEDYFKAIAEEIETEFNETSVKVDIETETFVNKAFENVIATKSVTIDETAKANTVKALSGFLPIVEVKASDDLTTSVIRFAVSTLQEDIKAVANGTASAEKVASYTSDVIDYIAQDQNISSNDITPDISAIDDNITTAEDTTVNVQVLSNDSYITTAPISISATNGDNGTVEVAESSPEQITYVPDTDYFGSDTFSYTITQGGKVSTADVSVNISPVNDVPSLDIASTLQVVENETLVTTISISDADEDELTLNLGGTDAENFNLSDEYVLSFKEAPDYEVKSSYSIELSLTDNIETVNKTITILIKNINDTAPEFTSDAEFNAAENQTTIGAITAIDADGDEVTFTISGEELAITPAGSLSFVSLPDYETKTSYSAIVTAFDGVNTTEQNITINILNINEPIVFTSPSEFTIDENTTLVGTVTATDPEGDDINIGLPTSGNGDDTQLFSINSAGLLSLKNPSDFETKSLYSLRVIGWDEGNREQITQIISVNINDINDAPSIDSSSTFIAAENQTDIGNVIATDQDGDNLVYSIISDDIIISANGILSFIEAPNYEVKDTYTATVRVGDGQVITTQDITVVIQDVNDTPIVSANSSIEVNENSSEIININASDEDGDTLSYSITGGTDSSVININQNGVLSFSTVSNYELPTDDNENNLYNIIVKVSDGNSEWSGAFNITVKNVNEAPTIGSNYPDIFEFNENATLTGYASQTVCGSSQIYLTCSKGEIYLGNNSTQVQINDEDGDTLNYSISGSDAEKFGITQNGSLYLLEAGDYEAQEIYNFVLNVSDDEFTSSKTSKVKFIDVNEKPVFTTNANLTIEENSKVVGTITATDPENDTVTFALTGTAGNGDTSSFAINSDSGELSFKNAPDYETKNQFTVYIEASDNDGSGSTTSKVFSVDVTNLNDNSPSFTSEATFSADENQTTIGMVAASDADGDGIVFSISGSDITINSSSGVIAFASAPDYETKTSYTATVTASDGIYTTSQDIAINISNVNDIAPVFSSEAVFSVEENQDIIGTVTATDEEGDDIIFSVSGSELIMTSSGELTFASTPDYESKSTYTAVVTASDGVNLTTQDITINVLNVDELSTANDCNYIVNDASSGEFRYCWEEAQSTSGSEYSANIVEPLTITFADESIEIPAISYAEKLYVEYGIVLESSGGDWTNDQAYAIYQTLQKIPQKVRNENVDYRIFSKWTLTDLQIQDDISFDKDAANIEVTLESSVFDNANPRIANVDGKKGIYFSNKLHNALVRFVTDNGNDAEKVNKILVERYGVTTTIDDYVALTGEQATRFQDFQAEELVAIIAMFEEMPSGYHKIEGLDYLVRRINGADNPYYPEAPAIAWDGSGYIEFMEKAFNTFSIDYLHRLILHEKAHFLWAKIFDDELKNNWIELGGWYECTEKESGWCTTKQTEFVSAYAHLKNPNEDMAESLSYFIVNPDALKSRSLAKYEFIRDRIMQGNIYISQIQENLTFKVYNLYPDYVFPGKVKKLFVSVDGAPTEDKTVTVEIKLHALDKILEGAAWARMRIFSTADTFFDLYLYPQNDQNLDTTLRGTFTLSKYAKSGYWKTSQLVLSDEVGNLRMEGANDFGWRMYVNNPKEDLDKPLYISNSMALTKSVTTIENQAVDVVKALWDIDEAHPRENQGCYGALNDENPSTYSIQKFSPLYYTGEYTAGKCMIEYVMPSYMPSGTYRLNYIKMFDEAGNESRNYFATPSGVDTGDFNDGIKIDELAKEVYLETTNPDTTPPELDLNSLSITAAPTNPDSPNGETIVKFTFRVKDDISGYKLGYYTFRDPQGLTSAYYHYPERRSEIFPSAEDLDWYEYTSTVTLPAGSAPGTWGVVELTLRDRALNFKTFNFTEIISFQTE